MNVTRKWQIPGLFLYKKSFWLFLYKKSFVYYMKLFHFIENQDLGRKYSRYLHKMNTIVVTIISVIRWIRSIFIVLIIIGRVGCYSFISGMNTVLVKFPHHRMSSYQNLNSLYIHVQCMPCMAWKFVLNPCVCWAESGIAPIFKLYVICLFKHCTVKTFGGADLISTSMVQMLHRYSDVNFPTIFRNPKIRKFDR